MDKNRIKLSKQAAAILKLIADGRSYDQILSRNPALSYHDISDAAQEVLDACSVEHTSYQESLAEIRKAHPRAYKPWTDEDADLASLIQAGHSVEVIAVRLGRQPSAIRSRIQNKGLAPDKATYSQAAP
jgi:hypothetical protein